LQSTSDGIATGTVKRIGALTVDRS